MKMKRNELMLFTLLSLISVGAVTVAVGASNGFMDQKLMEPAKANNVFSCNAVWNESSKLEPIDSGFVSVSSSIQLKYGSKVRQTAGNHCILSFGDINNNYISTSGVPYNDIYGGAANGLNSIQIDFDTTICNLKVEAWNSLNTEDTCVTRIIDSNDNYYLGFTNSGIRPNMFKITRSELDVPNQDELKIKSLKLSCTSKAEPAAPAKVDVYSEQDLITAVSSRNYNNIEQVHLRNDITLTKTLVIDKRIDKIYGHKFKISAAYDFGNENTPLIYINTGDRKNSVKFYNFLNIDGTNFSGGLLKIENSKFANSSVNFYIKETNKYGVYVSNFGFFETFNSFPISYNNNSSDYIELTNPNDFKRGIEIGPKGLLKSKHNVNSVYVHADGYVYDNGFGLSKCIDNLCLENNGYDTVKGQTNYGIYDSYAEKTKKAQFRNGLVLNKDGSTEKLIKYVKDDGTMMPGIECKSTVLRGCFNGFNPESNYRNKSHGDLEKFDAIYRYEPLLVYANGSNINLNKEISKVINAGKIIVKSGITNVAEPIIADDIYLSIEGEDNLSGKLVNSKADINLESYVIKAVNGAQVTINNVSMDGGNGSKKNVAVGAIGQGTLVTINGGKYSIGNRTSSDEGSVIYASSQGQVVINDGLFYCYGDAKISGIEKSPVLDNDDNNLGKIIVNGGIFENFNPANPCWEAISSKNEDGTTRYIRESFIDRGMCAYAHRVFDSTATNLVNAYEVFKNADDFLTYTLLSDGSYYYSDVELTGNLYFRVKNGTSDVLTPTINLISNTDINLNGATIGYAYERPDANIVGSHCLISVSNNNDVTIYGQGSVNATLNAPVNTYAVNVINAIDEDPDTNSSLNIWGGHFIGGATAVQLSSGYLLIEDGEFSVLSDNKNYVINCIDRNFENTAFVQVRGGKFNGFDPTKVESETIPTSFVTEGHKLIKNSDNSYTVIKPMTYNGIEMSIREFEQELAKTEGTYKLKSDILLNNASGYDNSLTTFIIISNDNLTIDLAGHKISFAQKGGKNNLGYPVMFTINGNANVTITDSIGGGTIDATNGESGAYAFNVNGANAQLTIDNGTFIGYDCAIQVQLGLAVINGGTFTMPADHNPANKQYIINCIDSSYKAGLANILIRGGTFDYDYSNDPEGTGTSTYIDRGYAVKEVNSKYIVEYVNYFDTVDENGKIVETKSIKGFETELNNTNGTYTLKHDIHLKGVNGEPNFINAYILLTNPNLTIDLAGHSIVYDCEKTINVKGTPCIFSLIDLAHLTINDSVGGGKIDVTLGNNGSYVFNLFSDYAKLTINGGTFVGAPTVAQVQHGTLVINGGTFLLSDAVDDKTKPQYIINCIDDFYKDGTARIIVNGGTFGFNPNANPEGPGTSYLGKDTMVIDNGDGTFTVTSYTIIQ